LNQERELLGKLIPGLGSCLEAHDQTMNIAYLEPLRVINNLYYDWYNNGLMQEGRTWDFLQVFLTMIPKHGFRLFFDSKTQEKRLKYFDGDNEYLIKQMDKKREWKWLLEELLQYTHAPEQVLRFIAVVAAHSFSMYSIRYVVGKWIMYHMDGVIKYFKSMDSDLYEQTLCRAKNGNKYDDQEENVNILFEERTFIDQAFETMITMCVRFGMTEYKKQQAILFRKPHSRAYHDVLFLW
jgi:hypothetical protein